MWGPQVGARAASQVHVRLTQPGEGRQYGLQAPTIPIRSRSPGIKRVKLDNGATLEVVQDRSGVDANINKPPRNNPKKAVTGTSNANITGRKIRSPPADIFVYGVHPDTTEDDIVLDLAESSIVITAKDVLKKSRDEAHLKSFKISVKAEDLQRALDPSVWPMRVKVREYIYYAKRAPRQDNGLPGAAHHRGGGHAGQPGAALHSAGGYTEQAGAAQQRGGAEQTGATAAGSGDQWQGAPTANMFAVLDPAPSAPAENGL